MVSSRSRVSRVCPAEPELFGGKGGNRRDSPRTGRSPAASRSTPSPGFIATEMTAELDKLSKQIPGDSKLTER